LDVGEYYYWNDDYAWMWILVEYAQPQTAHEEVAIHCEPPQETIPERNGRYTVKASLSDRRKAN